MCVYVCVVPPYIDSMVLTEFSNIEAFRVGNTRDDFELHAHTKDDKIYRSVGHNNTTMCYSWEQ